MPYQIERRETQIETEECSSSLYPHIGVMLTNRCDLRCEGCLAGIGTPLARRNEGNMSKFVIEHIVAQLGLLDTFFKGTVYITGGEPALHPDFIDIVQEFVSKGFFVTISSNFNWISPARPLDQQPKLKGLLNLLLQPNMRIKIPMDKMHFSANKNLPYKINFLRQLLDESEFNYGEQYFYGIIGNNLSDIVQGAILGGLEINESNALGLIRDWRLKQDVGQLPDLVNFIQISPNGLIYQNYYQMLHKNSLGYVNQLNKTILNMSQRISRHEGQILTRPAVNDWVLQANELLMLYKSVKSSS